MTIPDEAVQADKTLWCVNIQGPDDIIAAPDYLTAIRMSNAFNHWWLDLKTKQPHNDAIDARMWAVPTDWPQNNVQGHSDELSKLHPEYQWLRDLAAAPFLQGLKVDSMDTAPKNGDEFLARCGKEWPWFSCFWDGSAFVHYDHTDGIVHYPATEWIPIPKRMLALAPSPRAQALEEAAQALEAWGDIYGDNAAKCVRALSSQPVSDQLPQDVINLVIAAREAFDTGVLPDEEEHNLDKALDLFGERVPYENDPDALPASPEVSE